MYIVTGGAGFIGSQVVRGLNKQGITDIVVVDVDLNAGGAYPKWKNLSKATFRRYVDPQGCADYLQKLAETPRVGIAGAGSRIGIDAIIHMGAISSTTLDNANKAFNTNVDLTLFLHEFCADNHVPFVYASSAGVYGRSRNFLESEAGYGPLTLYAQSKLICDRYIVQAKKQPPRWAGLRFFNVYGPHEYHKDQPSPAWTAYRLWEHHRLLPTLFKGTPSRDFVYIDDVVEVVLWAALGEPESPNSLRRRFAPSGIYNVGTGENRPFESIVSPVMEHFGNGDTWTYTDAKDRVNEQYYQAYTKADLSALRAAGYTKPFLSVEQGMSRYLDVIKSTDLYV